jgi:hypothetical protein
METKFKNEHLVLIIRTQLNLESLIDCGILRREKVEECINLLDKKYDEIRKQLS